MTLMKIVCAPDSFKESVSAAEAAAAMAVGVVRACPNAVVDCCPVGDGGEGTGAVLIDALGGRIHTSQVTGPLAQPLRASWALLDDGTAIIEIAAAAGLHLVPVEQRDPLRTTTFGVGELIAQACAAGATRMVVCLGGSATSDGGAGMAQALGIRFRDAHGAEIKTPLTGGALANIAHIDAGGRLPPLADLKITVACDVANPLLGSDGAARVFAAQKGASPSGVEHLEAGLAHLARIMERDLGINMATTPRAGAAGGLGAGLMAFTGATLVPGIELVLAAVDFDRRISDADLCLTGEGCLDGQSLSGKACLGVAHAAARRGVPTIALVGALGPGAADALAAGLADARIIGPGLDRAESIRRAPQLLAEAAARAVTPYVQ
jgi:glycerate kinase